jgi:hypothetical protein
MLDRGFFRWVCIVAAALFALVWLLTEAGSGFSAPGWTGPAGLLALVIAVAMPLRPLLDRAEQPGDERAFPLGRLAAAEAVPVAHHAV